MGPFPLLALAAMLSAVPLSAEDACPPCPNGYRDVTLLAGSREFLEADQGSHFRAVNSTFESAAPSADRDDYWFSTAQEFRGQLLSMAKRCQRVKYMMIATHGGPGFISFGDGADRASNVELNASLPEMFGGLACALAPGATVKLAGCSVAAGCEGENFVASVAQLLLSRGGGVLLAERSDQRSLFGGLTPDFGFKGGHRLSVSPGGSIDWGERQPIAMQLCRQKLADAANDILARAPKCTGAANRAAMDSARQIQEAVAAFDALGDRFSGGPHLTALGQYNAAVDAVASAKRNACLR